jgi:hypothetical protein
MARGKLVERVLSMGLGAKDRERLVGILRQAARSLRTEQEQWKCLVDGDCAGVGYKKCIEFGFDRESSNYPNWVTSFTVAMHFPDGPPQAITSTREALPFADFCDEVADLLESNRWEFDDPAQLIED